MSLKLTDQNDHDRNDRDRNVPDLNDLDPQESYGFLIHS